MVTIRLTGHITPDGELLMDVPSGLPPGEVQIILELADEATEDDEPFTEEEIKDFLTFTPKTGAEIVASGLTGGWEDMGITDSVAWLEAQRKARRERSKW